MAEAVCWAYARRKFFDIHAMAEKANTSAPLSTEVLRRIGALYAIE
ncbi:MAG: hypothetical protein EAZ24_04085 [Burkholderiales bacterium]|nr:MAG: hypothetical protein EAZ24_04085 [Burkholderiales bacterium]